MAPHPKALTAEQQAEKRARRKEQNRLAQLRLRLRRRGIDPDAPGALGALRTPDGGGGGGGGGGVAGAGAAALTGNPGISDDAAFPAPPSELAPTPAHISRDAQFTWQALFSPGTPPVGTGQDTPRGPTAHSTLPLGTDERSLSLTSAVSGIDTSSASSPEDVLWAAIMGLPLSAPSTGTRATTTSSFNSNSPPDPVHQHQGADTLPPFALVPPSASPTGPWSRSASALSATAADVVDAGPDPSPNSDPEAERFYAALAANLTDFTASPAAQADTASARRTQQDLPRPPLEGGLPAYPVEASASSETSGTSLSNEANGAMATFLPGLVGADVSRFLWGNFWGNPWGDRILMPTFDVTRVFDVFGERLGVDKGVYDNDFALSNLADDFAVWCDLGQTRRKVPALLRGGDAPPLCDTASTTNATSYTGRTASTKDLGGVGPAGSRRAQFNWANLPEDYFPSKLAALVPHHFFIDACFPWPLVRDKIFQGILQGYFSELDLCAELWGGESSNPWDTAFVVHGDDPFDAEAYELSEKFVRKWGFLFSSKIIQRTNWWRRQRGLKNLVVEPNESWPIFDPPRSRFTELVQETNEGEADPRPAKRTRETDHGSDHEPGGQEAVEKVSGSELSFGLSTD